MEREQMVTLTSSADVCDEHERAHIALPSAPRLPLILFKLLDLFSCVPDHITKIFSEGIDENVPS